MTDDEIRNMPAGREMDWLVADIMGWAKGGDFFMDELGKTRTIEPTSFGSFQPSTDIAAAWEVVDKVIEEQWWMDFSSDFFMEYWSNDEWVVCNQNLYSRQDPPWEKFLAVAPTLPLAICRAALLAKNWRLT